jgi:hypothetical protein
MAESDHRTAAFRLTLVPVAGDERPVPVRLRQVLKFALRSQKLRCTSVQPVSDGQPDQRQETPTHE